MAFLPLIFRVLLSVAYVVLGIFMFLTKPLPTTLLNVIFGLACIVYGLFRGWRAWNEYQATIKGDL